LTLPHHNGGQLQFGPDGDLYVGMGDGGSGDDPPCHAQRDDTLLGKMLRLDVDQSFDTPPHYGIPPTNPLTVGPPEAWARPTMRLQSPASSGSAGAWLASSRRVASP
jgi:glucose/arabinose dehydrogenase